MPDLSVEQMCRDLLEQAVKDGLVGHRYQRWPDASPQARTSGELCGMANMLAKFLEHEVTGSVRLPEGTPHA